MCGAKPRRCRRDPSHLAVRVTAGMLVGTGVRVSLGVGLGAGAGGQLSVAELDLMDRGHPPGFHPTAFPDPAPRHPAAAGSPGRPGRTAPGGPAGEERVGDAEAVAALVAVVARLPIG